MKNEIYFYVGLFVAALVANLMMLFAIRFAMPEWANNNHLTVGFMIVAGVSIPWAIVLIRLLREKA